MNEIQEQRLRAKCEAYKVPFRKEDYQPQFDLPAGYVAGWIGGWQEHGFVNGEYVPTIYVGVSPEGDMSS